MENYPIKSKFLKNLRDEKPCNIYDLSNLLKNKKKNKLENFNDFRKSYTNFRNSSRYIIEKIIDLNENNNYNDNDNSSKNSEIRKNYNNLYKGKATKKIIVKFPKPRNDFLNIG